jgi:hypothetical protein
VYSYFNLQLLYNAECACSLFLLLDFAAISPLFVLQHRRSHHYEEQKASMMHNSLGESFEEAAKRRFFTEKPRPLTITFLLQSVLLLSCSAACWCWFKRQCWWLRILKESHQLWIDMFSGKRHVLGSQSLETVVIRPVLDHGRYHIGRSCVRTRSPFGFYYTRRKRRNKI